MLNTEQLLQKLISFKSITPDDDGCIDWIANLLESKGFNCHIQSFGPKGVKNLYAIYKSNLKNARNICLAGHVDVVPPGNGWQHPPFTATQINDTIYGRGAVDMKGGLAAMLTSTLKIIEQADIKKDISFLITADEEGDAQYGTKAMLEWMKENGHKIDFTFIGEPTSENQIGDCIKVGRRGSLHFDLTVKGTQGHIAYPLKALNPNTIMVQILHEIANLKLDEGNEFFEASNIEISTIDTNNPTRNVIPGCIQTHFNIRYNNIHTDKELIQKITAIITKHSNIHDLTTHTSAHPFLSKVTDYTKILTNAIEEETGIKTHIKTNGGTSDARFIQEFCPVAEFGLLSDSAHKINESVKIKDLQKLHDVYYHALSVILSN